MSFSLVLAGILTGFLAALYAIRIDAGLVWAALSYVGSGTLSLLGAGIVTAIRRNHWPRNRSWSHRLQQMTMQPSGQKQSGLFKG